jgi:hypothetical protein
MKSIDLGYYNQDFVFNAQVQVIDVASGFSFEIAQSGQDPIVSFSGQSGYLFDQQSDLIGGFRKNQAINISGNYFYGESHSTGNVVFDGTGEGRFSYFVNGNLIKNNISGQTGFYDTLYFNSSNDQNILTLSLDISTGSPCVLKSKDGNYSFPSEDDYYLASSDCFLN